jgi:hypothetical protein
LEREKRCDEGGGKMWKTKIRRRYPFEGKEC